MRVVLDTSALFYPRAIEALDPSWPVFVPSVVFLERSRQLAREGRMRPAEYAAVLRANGWQVEAFGVEEALRAPAPRLGDKDWKRLSRDAMIAGHVRPGDELWTANPRDFRFLGLEASRVVDVAMLR